GNALRRERARDLVRRGREFARVPWFRRGLRFTAIGLLLFWIVSLVAVPPLARYLLTHQVSAALGRPVAVQTVWFNPLSLTLTLKGLDVSEPAAKQSFASFERV